MARFTVSPQGIGRLMEAFAAGPQTRENARGMALDNQIKEVGVDRARREETAQRNLSTDVLRSRVGEEDSVALGQWFDGKRYWEKPNADGTGFVREPIVLPEAYRNNPEALTNLAREMEHLRYVNAYGPGGAGQIQQGFTVADSRQAAQGEAAYQGRVNQEIMRLAAAGDTDGMNRVIAASQRKFYEPNSVSGGTVFNKASGEYALTPLGVAQVDKYGSDTELARARTVSEVYGLDKTAAEIDRLKAITANENYRREHGLLGGGSSGRSSSGGALYKLNEGEIERRFVDKDGMFDQEAYTHALQEAAHQGLSLAEYLYKKDANNYVVRQFDDGFGYTDYVNAPDSDKGSKYRQYSQNVEKQINQWATPDAENPAHLIYGKQFDLWNAKQKEVMLENAVMRGVMTKEEAMQVFDLYRLDK